MEISTVHNFGSITCVKKIRVDWGERQHELHGDVIGSGDVQEIRCTYYGLNIAGKQYTISGWFGDSLTYDNWYSALRAVATQHGFSYEMVCEEWDLEDTSTII
jgi:hypothetical protein